MVWQAHYKAREEKCVSSGKTAFLYVQSTFSSTNKCGMNHVDLSLCKQLLVSSGLAVPACETIIYPGRKVFMLKIVYPICCGVDVHKTFIVATIAKTDANNLTTYLTKRFSTFTKDLCSFAVAGAAPLLVCLHGIDRSILDTRLQHTRTNL